MTTITVTLVDSWAYMGRWTKTPEKANEQTFELPAYPTTVIQNEPDMSEARRQVQHAKTATPCLN